MGSRLTGRGTPHDVTFEAATDLSTKQYTFVKLAAGATGGPAARITDASIVGAAHALILQNDPKQYKGGTVRTEGFSALKVDGNAGAIAVGDALTPDTNGLGVKAAAGAVYSAIACEASTAVGDIIEVWVRHGLLHA